MNDNEPGRESFNEDFCARLEYHLAQTFQNSKDEKLQGFWCDGISMPLSNIQLTRKSVNDTRRIETTAWLGYDGQQEYKMEIRFGQYSLQRYAKGHDLSECLPGTDSLDWITLDIGKRLITVQLK